MNKKERKNFAIFKHFFLVFLIRIINCLTLVEPNFKSVIFFFSPFTGLDSQKEDARVLLRNPSQPILSSPYRRPG